MAEQELKHTDTEEERISYREKATSPLDEVMMQAEKAYAAFMDAERQVAKAYHENEIQVAKAYKRAESQAQRAYDEAIIKAIKDRDDALIKASQVRESEVNEAYEEYKNTEITIKTNCEATIQKAREIHEAKINQAWDIKNEKFDEIWKIYLTSPMNLTYLRNDKIEDLEDIISLSKFSDSTLAELWDNEKDTAYDKL